MEDCVLCINNYGCFKFFKLLNDTTKLLNFLQEHGLILKEKIVLNAELLLNKVKTIFDVENHSLMLIEKELSANLKKAFSTIRSLLNPIYKFLKCSSLLNTFAQRDTVLNS